MRSSLAAKIGGAMALIVAAAVSATTLLNMLRFEETYQDFMARRLHVIAADIRRDLVFGLDLGLPLSAMENLPAILGRHITPDGIETVTLRDCKGAVVDSAGAPAPQESEWATRLPPESWNLFSPQSVILGMRIDNALGECAGAVTVLHNAALYTATVGRVRLQFLMAGAAALLVSIPAFLLVRRLFRRRGEVLGAIEANMSAILAGQPGEAADIDPQSLPPGDAIERGVVEAYRTARPALMAAAKGGDRP